MYSFSYLEPVCCSMCSSNCCFLTCIQVSQEAGRVVWYSHLFQNFPQFIVIHTVEGFGVVNKAEIDVFLELSCFFDDPVDVGNLISGSIAFPKTILNIWKVSFPRGNLNLYALFLYCFNVNGYMLTSPPFFLNSRIFHTLSPLCSSHLTVISLHSVT